MDANNPEGGASTEAAAAQALADVATQAITETAERTATLERAIAEIVGFRTDLASLRDEFRAHVESNKLDFQRIAGQFEALAFTAAATAETVAEIEEEQEEEQEEEEQEEEEQEEEEAAAIEGAASVEEAEAREPQPPTPHESHDDNEPAHEPARKSGRHFVRI